MSSQTSTWYVDFFRNDYLNVYGHLFTPERAEKESAFAGEALDLKPGARVLDLCCGQGRHSVPLARHGLRVTAFDLNPAFLELAQRAAGAAKVDLETVAGDMREIPFENYFDATVNMYSSFGYLESEAEDARVLDSIARASKPGARLLLDMLNREWAIDNYIQNDWHSDPDGTLYVERRDLDLALSRMRVSFTIVEPNGARRESIGHNIRLYTLTEMSHLLVHAGFGINEVFGGFEGETYAITTRRMIICASKL
ncbi:MAG TPA: class I SAM-dependent methyltransferase [Candidatus Binataceae bacterium]|nr:class I SAM-dependent methyltransferase [Candidatus Binataceae bacterium]